MATKKPNIVWVLTDDQGMGDLACLGNPIIKTPNIDAFYNGSVRMTNYHVGPTCAPTRSTLMTGHYANSTGVWHTIGGRSLLRKDEWTIATALGEAGYRTGIFGKWHLGDSYPYRACDRGFTKSIVHGGGGISQTPDFWGNDYFDDTYMVDGVPQKFEGYCTDVFFREGKRFIAECKESDTPFFCYLTPNAPHSPYNVPQKYYDMYKDCTDVPENRKRFYGMISNIDENFGALMAYLEDENLLDNTIVIFMTDNGTGTGITVNADSFVIGGYNHGMRGGKCSEYEGGHRVPFFLRYDAEGLNVARDEDRLTASIDLMPTLLDFCGVDVGEHTFHGTSLKGLLCEGDMPARAVVTDSQRLSYPQKWRLSSVMTDEWRLVNGAELYDIHADLEQRVDIAAEHPEVVAQLREEYEKWWEIVSVKYDEEIPISIGAQPNTIFVHDLRNMGSAGVFKQSQIRQGMQDAGHFEVLVEEDGEYRFALRRWAREYARPIRAGIDPANNDVEFARDCIMPSEHIEYEGGVALDLVSAEITIQGQRAKKEITDTDEAIYFTLPLKKGATHLKTWFNDAEQKTYATYYVEVEKV